MTTKNKEIAEVKTQEVATQSVQSVTGFIEKAIATGADPAVLEKLFSLQKDVKAEVAREAFTQALANFQRSCPVIEKTKKVLNKDGTVRYQFAPLDAIVAQIKTPLAENGLSFTWTVENSDKLITAIVKITHVMGHSEISSFTVPIDSGGFMTAPQQYASGLTFAKRYSLINGLGISTGEEDTDAIDVGKRPEPRDVKSQIMFLLKQLGEDTKTKDAIAKSVKAITNLALNDKNLPEIKSRLEATLKERQEYDKEESVDANS